MENNSDFLRAEIAEINNYAKQHFQLLLSWYTFFLTVNFTVLGWFTNLLLTNSLKTSLPIIYIALFFLVQITLSYLACLEVRKYFLAAYGRYCQILNLLSVPTKNPDAKPQAALPIQSYSKILALMLSTLASFSVFWLALLMLAIHLAPLVRQP